MTRVNSTLHEFMRPQLFWEDDVRVPDQPGKVALIAQFSTTERLPKSVCELARQLDAAGYFPYIVSASTARDPLVWEGERPERVAILRKPNIGYDFGSWAVGVAEQPQVLDAERLIVCNDSLVGPFWSLQPIIDDFEATHGDAWGLVRTHQVYPHTQSYFMGFTEPVLRSRTFADFWADVRVEPTKDQVIARYEFGLSQRLYSEGFVVDAFIDGPLISPVGLNPAIDGWLALLQHGVPFVKRELLLRPHVVAFGDRVAEVIKGEFDIDVNEWL